MSINNMLPFVSTIVMFTFSGMVFQRYFARRNPAFLFWGIGLLMFGLGSFAEAYLALSWNSTVFIIWYLFGAALNAGWIGHGTLNLLFKKPWVHVLTVILVLGSIFTTYLMLTTPLDASKFTVAKSISDQYREIMPPAAQAPVRLTTPFFNIYGLITIVGGALYSTFLFWRKRVLPNRVLGNVLIAAGALSISAASTLTRLGYGQFLYVGELVAAVLMFSGFLLAAAPESEAAQSPEATAVKS
jgi:hypothetical protein